MTRASESAPGMPPVHGMTVDVNLATSPDVLTSVAVLRPACSDLSDPSVRPRTSGWMMLLCARVQRNFPFTFQPGFHHYSTGLGYLQRNFCQQNTIPVHKLVVSQLTW